MNEGTFAAGAHMFEMPVVRVSLGDGAAVRLTPPGATVEYSMSLSRDGRTLAYREVGARDMGDLVVLDVASQRKQRLTTVNPELTQLALGELKPISWKSFDGMEIWGPLLTPPGYDSRGASAGQALSSLLVYCHGGPIGGVTLGSSRSSCMCRDRSIRIQRKRLRARGSRCCFRCRAADRATAKPGIA